MLPIQFSTGIQPRTQVIMLLIGLATLLFVLYMVRRKQIREQYSLLWIFGALMILLSSAFTNVVEKVSHLVGVYYPPAFLFLLAILMMFALQFHVSVVISGLREQNRSLTQDLGLLASEVRELRRQLAEAGGAAEPRP